MLQAGNAHDVGGGPGAGYKKTSADAGAGRGADERAGAVRE